MGMKERLENAITADPGIICLPENCDTHPGRTEDYLINMLGLTKGDLQRLARGGLAIKVYTKNRWMPGDKLPSGKAVAEGTAYHGSGHKKHWIIVLKEIVK